MPAIFMVVVACFLSVPGIASPRIIHIASGSPNGTYYPYGSGLARIWSGRVPEIRAVAEATGASKDNLRLIINGQSQCGAVRNDLAYQAAMGSGAYAGRRQNICGMFAMYPDVYHLVSMQADSISGLTDLYGRTVSVGAKGSGTELMSALVLKRGLDIPYAGLNLKHFSFIDSARALLEKRIDAAAWAIAPPTISLMRLSVLGDIKIIPFTSEEMDQVTGRLPFYVEYTLAADVYRGQHQPVLTPAVWNMMVCRTDLDADLVYQLVKATYAGYKGLVRVSPFAKETTPENTLQQSIIPLHPGAIRYYRERGLEIPSQLEQ